MWMWTTCAAMRNAMNPKMHAHPSIPSSSSSSSSWPGPLLCAFKIVCVHLLWVHRKQKWNQVYTKKTNESGQKKKKRKVSSLLYLHFVEQHFSNASIVSSRLETSQPRLGGAFVLSCEKARNNNNKWLKWRFFRPGPWNNGKKGLQRAEEREKELGESNNTHNATT